ERGPPERGRDRVGRGHGRRNRAGGARPDVRAVLARRPRPLRGRDGPRPRDRARTRRGARRPDLGREPAAGRRARLVHAPGAQRGLTRAPHNSKPRHVREPCTFPAMKRAIETFERESGPGAPGLEHGTLVATGPQGSVTLNLRGKRENLTTPKGASY